MPQPFSLAFVSNIRHGIPRINLQLVDEDDKQNVQSLPYFIFSRYYMSTLVYMAHHPTNMKVNMAHRQGRRTSGLTVLFILFAHTTACAQSKKWSTHFMPTYQANNIWAAGVSKQVRAQDLEGCRRCTSCRHHCVLWRTRRIHQCLRGTSFPI